MPTELGPAVVIRVVVILAVVIVRAVVVIPVVVVVVRAVIIKPAAVVVLAACSGVNRLCEETGAGVALAEIVFIVQLVSAVAAWHYRCCLSTSLLFAASIHSTVCDWKLEFMLLHRVKTRKQPVVVGLRGRLRSSSSVVADIKVET